MNNTNFTEELTSITRQIEHLRTQNEQLQAEIAQLKASPAITPEVQSAPLQNQSRRKLLKRMAALTVGATAAATALATSSSQASADGVGTVTGSSTENYGLTASPFGVGTFTPTSNKYGVIGVTSLPAPDEIPVSAGVLGYGLECGVYARTLYGTSIYGTTDRGIALMATSTNYIGIVGEGNYVGIIGFSNNGTGARFKGKKATIRLDPDASAPAGIPNTGVHHKGELMVTNEGENTNLYLCIQGNDTSVGTWVRLNQPYTAGANINISPRNADGTFTISATSNVVFLDSPVRVAASTNAGGSLPLLSSDGSGNSNTAFQTIQITGTTIPATAKGIIGTLSSVGATKEGQLKLWAFGKPVPVDNTLTMSSQQKNEANLTTGFTTKLGANGKVNLAYSNTSAGSTCGFSLTVIAYVL